MEIVLSPEKVPRFYFERPRSSWNAKEIFGLWSSVEWKRGEEEEEMEGVVQGGGGRGGHAALRETLGPS